jgi:hypothetical protein
MNQRRKGSSPIIVLIGLVFIGFVFVLLLMVYPSAETMDESPNIEFVAVNSFSPVTVDNAKHQLVLYVSNSGQGTGIIYKVYFNSDLVKINGIKDGDLLPDSLCIASSIVDGGTHIPPGETVQIFIWTGDGLNMAGNYVVIHLNSLNDSKLTKSVIIK